MSALLPSDKESHDPSADEESGPSHVNKDKVN